MEIIKDSHEVMGVVGLLDETVEEEELGIILNATKVTITTI